MRGTSTSGSFSDQPLRTRLWLSVHVPFCPVGSEWHYPDRKETEAEWLSRRQAMHCSSRVETFGPCWRIRLRCACGREIEGVVRQLGRVGAGDTEVRTLGRFIERSRCKVCGGQLVGALLTGSIDGTEIELIGRPVRWWGRP